MLAVIDNYDSFTYNLVQYFGELGADPKVYRNDAITLDELAALGPSRLVISPGPGTPEDGGVSNDAIRYFTGRIPVLGVCLGHQCLGAVYGGQVVRAPRLMHGKTCPIVHSDDELFDGIPSPFTAMRYHSLVVDPASLPPALVVTAMSADRQATGDAAEIMAMKHRDHPTYGVQFHPESIGTEHGKRILENFLRVVRSTSLLA